ncbi:dipeptide epimerase [Clostridium grantii]|uniref:Dipeptide epimerase n=1 Tax=Clostridium grantii DSM 8605 TaxID=1121316 RepID=A0A1M5UEL8_9CLOT|nr:dipeptide epimerase [Clostridium grantii]SHH61103.1 o-succinylbenzoate synthase [Clostridium grantii DSM 8605]
MIIKDITTERIQIPLKKPFKTALRTVRVMENIIVRITTDEDIIGYGAAAPTEVITGDTIGSIINGVDHIKSNLLGRNVEDLEENLHILNNCLIGNTSAKAAIDIGLYDLYAKLYKAPLYKILGNYKKTLHTDITISLNEAEEMARDSIEAINEGYKVLKIKVGKDGKKDLERMKAIRQAVGKDIKLRVDANQGWKPKEAIYAVNNMLDAGVDIEIVEQPVFAKDFKGMKMVTDNVPIPVLADESVFSPEDAMELINMRAADMINIKLMKTGGIYNALKIVSIAESNGIECMIGSMMESKIGVSAAAHLAGAKRTIIDVDLDVPLLCKEEPVNGGIIYNKSEITFNKEFGLGVIGLK